MEEDKSHTRRRQWQHLNKKNATFGRGNVSIKKENKLICSAMNQLPALNPLNKTEF